MAYADLPSSELVNFSFRDFESTCGSDCTGGVFVSDLQGHSLETSQLWLPESGDSLLQQDIVCTHGLRC